MKKIPANDRTNARRSRSTRFCHALSPHAGNGASQSIHVLAAGFASDRRRPPIPRYAPNANASVLEDLSRALDQVTAGNHPRTFKLLQSSQRKLARKLIEEACEVTVEAVKRDPDGVVRESADLLYHLIVLWFHIGIEPIEIWEEMQTRADALGIAEKLPKTAVRETAAD
jgi:phosphoribosyl-ATP pyrophosphohydrolase